MLYNFLQIHRFETLKNDMYFISNVKWVKSSFLHNTKILRENHNLDLSDLT